MLKSKEITDFVEASLSDLRVDEATPSDLHLYFKTNHHVLLWQPAGTVFTSESIERYRSRGIDKVWVHKSDWESFYQYAHARPAKPEPPPRRQVLSQELIYKPIITARQIVDIMGDETKSERERRALVAKSSRSLLGELAAPDTLARQRPVSVAVSRVVRDLLTELTQGARVLASQLWETATSEPEFSHGVNVATLSVLFALAFGKIDGELLANLGMAALLHDVGVTQLPLSLVQIPWESLSSEQMLHHLDHISMTADLISSFAPEISTDVTLLIQEHHESFSDAKIAGTPAEIAQLISMADIIDSLCNGNWDGEKRTVLNSMVTLEEQENRQVRPRFNKEVFAAIIRWTRGSLSEMAQKQVMSLVGEQLRAVRGKAS